MNSRPSLIVVLIALLASTTYGAAVTASYEGKYCELEGAVTENGDEVSGECHMYSDEYGELDGAQTEDGESVTGECYRYSDQYGELESATTEDGLSVTGECYFD